MSDYLLTRHIKLISCKTCFDMRNSIRDIANDKGFPPMDFGAERGRRGEGTGA